MARAFAVFPRNIIPTLRFNQRAESWFVALPLVAAQFYSVVCPSVIPSDHFLTYT